MTNRFTTSLQVGEKCVGITEGSFLYMV